MRRGACYGMSCDDISLDVITISRWLEIAQKTMRRRTGDQQKKRSAKLKRRRIEIQQMDSAGSYSAISRCYWSAKIQQVETVLPVENLFVSAVATLPVVVKSSRKIQSQDSVARFSRSAREAVVDLNQQERSS
ncbi:hypothetical protein F511_45382 [Dorcoceras hygrometricum]|uniref:Uncharacterized protein n=1 Tax=Dorcoceras hygrometricum TaxID=472368 RepID=A0A2Z7A3D4_9LAMI|nr:hypothetical protein F511_45382 [Dorcoceras hygrometricum]